MHPYLPMIDSFDHYATGQGERKWTQNAGSIVAGRNGNGMQITGTGAAVTWFAADYQEICVGAAYKTSAFANSPIALRTFRENPALAVMTMIELAHLGDGRLLLKGRLANGTVLTFAGPSAFVMQIDQWYYLELYARIQGIAGNFAIYFTARVNEEVIMTGSAGTIVGFPWIFGTFNGIWLTGPGAGQTAIIDDFYAAETATFLGDIRIGVIRPNGAGAYSAWTPNGGVDHYDRVNEHSPDDDTTYLAAASALKEIHNYEDISVSGVIKAVQTLNCVKKTDAGTATTRSILRSGVAEDLGQTFYPSEESYLYDRKGYLVSPFTGVAFSEAEVNGLQYGLERLT